jgi:hypothetical protein
MDGRCWFFAPPLNTTLRHGEVDFRDRLETRGRGCSGVQRPRKPRPQRAMNMALRQTDGAYRSRSRRKSVQPKPNLNGQAGAKTHLGEAPSEEKTEFIDERATRHGSCCVLVGVLGCRANDV